MSLTEIFDSFKIIHYEENKIVWMKDGKNGREQKMKELTKSEEQMMDIFWDSKEALTSVDIVKMQVKATWTNGLVHNIIRSLVQNGYLKECGMEQFGRQYARKLMPALTREEYIAKLMIQKSEGKSSVKQMVVALAKESEDMEQVIEELEEIIRKLKEEQ